MRAWHDMFAVWCADLIRHRVRLWQSLTRYTGSLGAALNNPSTAGDRNAGTWSKGRSDKYCRTWKKRQSYGFQEYRHRSGDQRADRHEFAYCDYGKSYEGGD